MSELGLLGGVGGGVGCRVCWMVYGGVEGVGWAEGFRLGWSGDGSCGV